MSEKFAPKPRPVAGASKPARSKSTKPKAVAGAIAAGTPCPVYRKCGGCQLQNMPYEKQLAWKQSRVRTLLGTYATPEPIIGMKHPYHYRNKVQAAFGTDIHGNILSGVYQSGTHRIVKVDRCMTEDEKADEIIVTIRGLLPKCKMTTYDERRGTGFLRHVLIKRGFESGEIMVVLVSATPMFTAKKHFLRALLELHPEITTVLLNINPRSTSMVLGEDERVLYGPGRIEETLCGLRFSISARAFYQINPLQTQVLYQTAIDMAQLTGKESVIDAYCGVGTIGLIAARTAGQVLGVENNASAIQDAKENAKRNQITNIHFTCADAGEYMQYIAEEGEHVDVVLMDPPRAGSDACFLRALLRLAPQKIVYISCNPETQARDLAVLRCDYRVKKIQPVDMFPHTNHIECVVKLCRVEK